jgi:hypothetical protein
MEAERFLCLCDLFLQDKQSITFQELWDWSSCCDKYPNRLLYQEGRKFFCANGLDKRLEDFTEEEKQEHLAYCLEKIDVEKIRSFVERLPREKNLLTLGEIMEVMGKNAHTLLNPVNGKVVSDYVNLFAQYSL